MRPRGQPWRHGQHPAMLRTDGVNVVMAFVVRVDEVFLQAIP